MASKKTRLFLLLIILGGFLLRVFHVVSSLDAIDTFMLSGILGGLAAILAIFYFAREIFNEGIALLSAFFVGVSAWPLAISRETLWPNWFLAFFILSLYFLWKGLRGSHKCNFIFSGIFLGLVLYLSSPFFVPLIIALLGFFSYWHLLKKELGQTEYQHGKNFILEGLFFSTILAVATFLLLFLLKQFGWHFGQADELISPHALSLPIAVFLAAGLFRSLFKFFKILKKHRHFSPVHVILLSWLLLGLASQEAIFALPVIMILAAEGCWWLFNWSSRFRYYPFVGIPRVEHIPRWTADNLVPSLVLAIFLASLALLEIQSYFGF